MTGMKVIIQSAERKLIVSNSAQRYFHNFHRIQKHITECCSLLRLDFGLKCRYVSKVKMQESR